MQPLRKDHYTSGFCLGLRKTIWLSHAYYDEGWNIARRTCTEVKRTIDGCYKNKDGRQLEKYRGLLDERHHRAFCIALTEKQGANSKIMRVQGPVRRSSTVPRTTLAAPLAESQS
jgi:hypothetical protein